MARVIALAGLLGFLLALAVEHLTRPSLDPLRHQISDYVGGAWGWVMVAGFVLWAAAFAASAAWSASRGRHALAAAFVVAALGMMLTACFTTQTSAGVLPPGVHRTWAGRLHDLGSGSVALALVLAIATTMADRRERPVLRRLSAFVLGMAVALSAVLLAIGPTVGGVRQRALVVLACAWHAARLMRGDVGRQEPPRAGP